MFDKVKNWVSDNQKPAMIAGVVLVGALYFGYKFVSKRMRANKLTKRRV